jgi:Leucine-rich repeat (LRR) protein
MLRELSIKNNPGIEEIPETIGKLKELRSLDVQNCALVTIPFSIGDLCELKKLDLKKNQISSSEIPESIGFLENLVFLSLRYE